MAGPMSDDARFLLKCLSHIEGPNTIDAAEFAAEQHPSRRAWIFETLGRLRSDLIKQGENIEWDISFGTQNASDDDTGESSDDEDETPANHDPRSNTSDPVHPEQVISTGPIHLQQVTLTDQTYVFSQKVTTGRNGKPDQREVRGSRLRTDKRFGCKLCPLFIVDRKMAGTGVKMQQSVEKHCLKFHPNVRDWEGELFMVRPELNIRRIVNPRRR